METAAGAEQLAAYERRFRRAGLPLFVEDFSAATDVFNRAVPLLALVVAAQMLGAISLDWSPLANVAAALGGLAILLVSIGILNRIQGRPFRTIPRTVERGELAAFVLVPALLPLTFGGQWRSALVTAAGNLALLGLIYGVLGLGLPSILRWVAARFAGQVASSFGLLTRAVPLLMIFSMVLFLTNEVWQVTADVPPVTLAILGGMFVGLGTVFLFARLPREVAALERDVGGDGPALNTRQRLNVGLVLFVSQALQVFVVSLVIAGFFVALGLLIIDQDILRDWVGHGGHVLVTLDAPGRKALLTEELLRVAGAIAAFTGLYFAISMLTDDVYRKEFLEDLTADMRASFKARTEYLKLRG